MILAIFQTGLNKLGKVGIKNRRDETPKESPLQIGRAPHLTLLSSMITNAAPLHPKPILQSSSFYTLFLLHSY